MGHSLSRPTPAVDLVQRAFGDEVEEEQQGHGEERSACQRQQPIRRLAATHADDRADDRAPNEQADQKQERRAGLTWAEQLAATAVPSRGTEQPAPGTGLLFEIGHGVRFGRPMSSGQQCASPRDPALASHRQG